MKIRTCLALVAAVAAGCGGAEPVALAEAADAGGISISATSELEDDSLRVRVRLTNELDTSADITLNGGCPISVVTVAEAALVWDEREQRVCDTPDIPLQFAPGEYRDLFHSVAGSVDPSLQAEDGRDIGVRVLVAVDKEYLLEAGER